MNGNQTFVRILKLEYLYGGKFKPKPSIIHHSYAGRIRALSSSTNTHSLLLMNITDTDLMLYCCMDFTLEQSHCSKLDYQGICFRQFLCTLKYINLKWMIMWAINAFNSASISISVSLETYQENKEFCHILSILLGDRELSTEDVDQDTDTISHDPVISDIVLWLPVICVLLLLLLVSSVYVCWRGTGLWKGGFFLRMIFSRIPKFYLFIF